MSLQAVPIDSWANIFPAVGWFFAWTTLYFVLCLLNSRRSYEWHVRCITAIHAVIVVCMSGWSGFVLGPWPFTDPGGPMTLLEYITCNVCLGYFLFDFAWCLYFRTEGPVMLLHHALSITGNVLILFWGVSGTEMMAAIFGSELTNPFLQMRWFLRERKQHKTWFGELNDIAFMLLFFYLRICVGTSLLYWVLQHPNPGFLVKLGGVLHYSVGWAFLLQIVRYAFRKYTKMYRESQASSKKTDDDVTTVLSNGNGKMSEERVSTATPTSGYGIVADGSPTNGVTHRRPTQE